MIQACNTIEIRELREELERHEDAARMFCEITCDLNNLIAAMKGQAQLAQEEEDDQEFRELATLVLENSSKAQNVIQLGLSRIAQTDQTDSIGPFDIPDSDSECSIRILVIDDEPSIRNLLSRILRKSGYEVLTAANGTEAIAEAKANQFHIAFLDLNLGDMSGIDVFKQLKRNSPQTHVAFLSGDPSLEQLRNNVHVANLASFIKKPFEIKEINNFVSCILPMRGASPM